MGSVAIHSPLLGYANNYDFIKLSSTVGIWVDEPGVNRYAGHASAPYSRYRTHGVREPIRLYLSSELLLLLPAIAAGDVLAWIGRRPPHRFDLRVLGSFKWVVFSVAGALLTMALFRRSPWLGLGSALIFAIVIADPVDTLYFNTLYFDDSAVLFTWLAVGFALLALHPGPQPRWLLPAFCGSLFLAGLSKMQHPGLPLAIVLGYTIQVWSSRERVPTRKVLAPVIAALLALIAGFLNNQSRSLRSMAQAAATDTWFFTVLPVLRDPPALLAKYGIPARCSEYVGKSWYHPGMQPPPCPEIFRLSRFAAVAALLREPSALFGLLVRGAIHSRPFLLPYGHVEGEEGGRIERQGARFWSVAEILERIDETAFLALWALVLGGGAVGIALLATGHGTPLASVAVLANAVCAATFCASLLGDGLMDFARHVHLGQNAWLVAAAVSAAMLLELAVRMSGRIFAVRTNLHDPAAAATPGHRGRSDGRA